MTSCALRKTRGQFPSGLLHHHMVPKIEGPCHIWVEGMLCLPLEVRMAKCRVDGRTPQACSLQEASPSSYLLRPLQLQLSPLLLRLLLLLLLLLLRDGFSNRVNNSVGGDLRRLLGHLMRMVLGIQIWPDNFISHLNKWKLWRGSRELLICQNITLFKFISVSR